MSEITLGMLKKEDAEELRAVAERDSQAAPAGLVLGARMDGRLVAARSIDDGHAVADPFVRTAEVQELLAERAAQMRGPRPGGLRWAFARFGAQASSSSRVAA
jgi:hypothetical protein